ncbi:MAG: DegT/DnrJ/EryC1/StrS family aminotransferase [Planctomycetes bacterium]|nr:DegT/DnrJ/EryC1/StrS family aminotransferase [Planctomycetota bacterium]
MTQIRTNILTTPINFVPNDADASGRSFGEDEIRMLREVLERGVLISQYGKVVPRLENAFAAWCDVPHCTAVSSGTAALHTAIAAVDPQPGDEFISSPITDMGAIMPVFYQGAIPIFADVDPITCNVTAETIAARISSRTKAIIVTHLFGLPCDMDPIMALAKKHGIMVIEDAAQGFGATYKGRKVGTIGDVGCFSLQQGKHITCGEGGFVVTRDAELARFMKLYHDKGWGFGDAQPDHEFLGLNYRMTELQGAVAMAQLPKLDEFVAKRRELAARLTQRLSRIDGIICPPDHEDCTHVYWRYSIRVVEPLTAADLDRMSNALRSIGARTAPRYTQKLAFEYGFIKNRKMFGNSGFPFNAHTRSRGAELMYDRSRYPGAVNGLDHLLCIGWNERYDESVVDLIATTILRSLKGDLQ